MREGRIEHGHGTARRNATRAGVSAEANFARQSAQGPIRRDPTKERAAKARRAAQTARLAPNSAGARNPRSTSCPRELQAEGPRNSNRRHTDNRRTAARRSPRSRYRRGNFHPRPFRSRRGSSALRLPGNTFGRPLCVARRAPPLRVRSGASPAARRPTGMHRRACCGNDSPGPRERRGQRMSILPEPHPG